MENLMKSIILIFGVIVMSMLAFSVGVDIYDQYNKKIPKQKPEYDSICIGGYQYELMVNEFNEPVWCGEEME